MVKVKMISVVIICSLVAGCAASSASPGLQAVKPVNNEISKNPSNNGKTVQTSKPEKHSKDAPKPFQTSPSPTPAPMDSQPGPRQEEKLDFEVLDKLSNKKLSWWIQLNKEHKTPYVPEDIKGLVRKYEGIYIGDTSKKVVYLTFDEGYENGYTGKILDTLKANNVKSIFFVTGPYIKEQKALVKRMLDEGHQVGNHSITHPSLPEVSDASLENEMYGLEKQFTAMYGKGFKYMRPPRGEYSERTLAAAKQLGYKTAFWSFAYMDYDTNNQKGSDYAYRKVMSNLHNGAVLLLHAVSKDNAEALDRIIKDIKAKGYEISPFNL